MKVLTFNEATHTYTVDGVVVPGVTTVLGAVGIPDLSMVPKELLERSSAFGTAVHRACELDDKDDLDETDLDEALRAPLEQWRQIRDSLVGKYGKPEKELIEVPLYSALGFAGKPDNVWCYPSKSLLITIDKKTGITSQAGPQTAAYEKLAEELFGIKFRKKLRFACHLLYGKELGKLVEFKQATDWNVFLSALNIHKYKRS
jgi:hypothetical protein